MEQDEKTEQWYAIKAARVFGARFKPAQKKPGHGVLEF
jgi:hypothetical protein